MLLGYIRISKSDGSQSLDLQRDASLPQEWLQSASTKIVPLVAMTRVPGWRHV